jgi:hypothetical protein
MSNRLTSKSFGWALLQCIAALTVVAAALLIELFHFSLTPARYSAEIGAIPIHLSECAYIVPRNPAKARGLGRLQTTMCFFGSRESHQGAYMAAWVAIGLSIALLLWTALTGRGMPVYVRYR